MFQLVRLDGVFKVYPNIYNDKNYKIRISVYSS